MPHGFDFGHWSPVLTIITVAWFRITKTRGLDMTHFRHRLLIITAVLPVTTYSAVAVGDDAEDTQRICAVVDAMGSSVKCAVSESEHAVDLTADTTAVDAMQLCISFAGMVEAMTHTLSDHWTMRVFSEQNSDTPVAVCDLG